MTRAAALTGWGAALPPAVVTNADLEARLDTTDAWITERTGIRERRTGGSVGELATAAGREALRCAGLDPAAVDLLVLATTTPDQTMPATSAVVHRALGLGGGGYDLNAACAGFVYGLFAAYGAIATGAAERVLLVGSDTMTTIVDPDDLTTAVLFGDGAGAVVLESKDSYGSVAPTRRRHRAWTPAAAVEDNFLGWDLGIDGSGALLLQADHGGTLTMEGKEVYRRAVRATVESAGAALKRSACTADDIALFVPHQANLRIIEAVADRLGMPMERVAVMVERTGNTSAASIPLAIAEAASSGRLAEGDLVLVSGFGAGMAWASAVVRWGP